MPKDIQSRTKYFVREKFLISQKTKESRRRKFFPSRKTIRNLILSVRNKARYSKTDQENITHLKDKYIDYGEALFESFKKHIVVKENEISSKQTYFYILFLLIYLFISFTICLYLKIVNRDSSSSHGSVNLTTLQVETSTSKKPFRALATLLF